MDCAIPLISIGEDNSFVVNEEAIALLATIESKVCITAAAGLYRTGKSSLLNWLANRSKGFAVGPTINRCTRGIWIWGEPIMCTTASGEECACVILDTEGLGGVESNLKYDTRIFSLIVLLCSTLIYNSMGSIDENAISNLSLVTQLSENIKLTNNPVDESGGDDALNFYKVFPSFIWVIRDFTLDLEDEDGYEITPTQYLNSSLEQNPGYDKQTLERNRIRHMLTSFFPDRECVTLIRPISDEEALQQVDDLAYDDLREDFRDGMATLRHLIFENARLKTIDGKALSGAMFGGLVRSYVKAINEGGVPTISSAWEGVSEQECLDAKEKSIDLYKTIISTAVHQQPFPVESEELIAQHTKASTEAMQLFHQRAVGPSVRVIVQELESELQIILGNYEQENRKAGDVFCDNLITELYDSLIRHKLMSDDTGDVKPKRVCVYASDMQLFRQDWELLLRKYSAEARGPSKWRVLSESLKVKMIDCSTVIINFVTNDYEKQVAVLHQEVQDSATRLSTVDAEFHVLQDNADQLAARNKELETTVIDLGVKCKAQDTHFTSLSSEHSDLLAKYDEERDVRTRLEVKMEKSSERLAVLEGYETSCFELTHEKDALLIALKELEEEVAALKKRKKKKCVIS
jgi:hypothetical protein